MYSRSGLLPRVMRKKEDYEPEYLTLEAVQGILGKSDTARPFDVIFGQLKQDINKLLQSADHEDNVLDSELKVFFEHLDRVLYATNDPEKIFLDDVTGNDATFLHESIDSLLRQADDIFATYVQSLSAEEFILLKHYIAPRIQKARTRIPMVNARKLLALMQHQKRYLSIKAVGESKVTQVNNGVRLKYGNDQHIDHKYFVEATGQSGYLPDDTRQFTQSLMKSGLAQTRTVRFQDQEHAGELDAGHVEKGVDRKRIKKIDGEYYYEVDGVEMDPRTLRLIPKSDAYNQGAIYASPPLTFSYFPSVQILRRCVDFAGMAVADIENRRSAPVMV